MKKRKVAAKNKAHKSPSRKEAMGKVTKGQNIMKMIGELDCDRYTSCEDNVSLQQVFVVSCVGVANPFHAH